jgi:outer membrane protein OmpU
METTKWSEFALIGDYLLSKRTDVYVSANYLKSSGAANAALWTETPSSNRKQLALRVGMRHRF